MTSNTAASGFTANATASKVMSVSPEMRPPVAA